MNLAFQRELELTEYDALQGDAEKYFQRESRLIAMDVHGDSLPMRLLDNYRLIASLRADRFKTAQDLWAKMNRSMTSGERSQLWLNVWSVPEAKSENYKEIVYAIMGDPTGYNFSKTKVITFALISISLVVSVGGWIYWGDIKRIDSAEQNQVVDSASSSSSVNEVTSEESNEPIAGTTILMDDVVLSGTEQENSRILYNTENLYKNVSSSIVMFVPVIDLKYADGEVQKKVQGHGSGFFFKDRDGRTLIMTNKHVTKSSHAEYYMTSDWAEIFEDANASLINVTLYGIVQDTEPRLVTGRVLYEHPSIDLAIVQLAKVTQPHLDFATINPSVGSDVVVVGYRGTSSQLNESFNAEEKEQSRREFSVSDTSKLIELMSPNKEFLPTLSSGKVSNIFSVPTEDKSRKFDVIEHSAMISGGNSGGPMFNMYGEVTGMLTWGGTSQKDMSGAIVEEKDQAINLCIGVEEILIVLAEWERIKQ